MPTLEFKGKPFVYSHHLSVPFRELIPVPDKSVPGGKKASLDDNLIIHGDNLEALKALLPRYAGKVDVIYIDPPYNTGKEGWTYNDNVNSSLMKQWLAETLQGHTVDGNDLERHDKWLCMMWPRLSLLHELLRDEGVFFCSIDDNEMHEVRAILDDIFGDRNFLGQISVLVNPKGRGLKDSDFAKTHEYVVVYQKGERENALGTRKTDAQVTTEYKYTDQGGEKFRLLELRNTHREFGRHNRPNLWFPLYAEKVTGDDVGLVSTEPRKNYAEVWPLWDDGYEGCWTWDGMSADENCRLLRSRLVDGRYKIYRMAYSKDVTGRSVKQKIKTIWTRTEFFTERGVADFEEILPGSKFAFPKPSALIKQLLSLVDSDNYLVLDSFAGSGTTAQAALTLNYEDGGHRRFVLVEAENYADALTSERIRRVIKGVPNAKDEALKKGLGGSFTYCELGEPIDLEKFFEGNGAPAYEQVARYVIYTATGASIAEVPSEPKKDWFIGEAGGYRIHLLYKPDLAFMRGSDAVLTRELAQVVSKAARRGTAEKPVLFFAAQKYLSQKELSGLGITFCQLPYSIYRVLGGAPDAA